MTHPDLDILAATAYETGIDPIDYAAENVIQAHVDVFLALRDIRADLEAGICRPVTTGSLSRMILGDLLGAGWTPPEVTR